MTIYGKQGGRKVKYELGDEENNATTKETAKSDYKGLRK